MARKDEGREGRCGVIGCPNPGKRSMSRDRVEEAGFEVEEGARKVHLCKDHYKEYKKATKVERKLETLGR